MLQYNKHEKLKHSEGNMPWKNDPDTWSMIWCALGVVVGQMAQWASNPKAKFSLMRTIKALLLLPLASLISYAVCNYYEVTNMFTYCLVSSMVAMTLPKQLDKFLARKLHWYKKICEEPKDE